jgi:hypothetical protein
MLTTYRTVVLYVFHREREGLSKFPRLELAVLGVQIASAAYQKPDMVHS